MEKAKEGRGDDDFSLCDAVCVCVCVCRGERGEVDVVRERGGGKEKGKERSYFKSRCGIKERKKNFFFFYFLRFSLGVAANLLRPFRSENKPFPFFFLFLDLKNKMNV